MSFPKDHFHKPHSTIAFNLAKTFWKDKKKKNNRLRLTWSLSLRFIDCEEKMFQIKWMHQLLSTLWQISSAIKAINCSNSSTKDTFDAANILYLVISIYDFLTFSSVVYVNFGRALGKYPPSHTRLLFLLHSHSLHYFLSLSLSPYFNSLSIFDGHLASSAI